MKLGEVRAKVNGEGTQGGTRRAVRSGMGMAYEENLTEPDPAAVMEEVAQSEGFL